MVQMQRTLASKEPVKAADMRVCSTAKNGRCQDVVGGLLQIFARFSAAW